MGRKIILTLIHDFLIFLISFFLALWIRLDFNYATSLIPSLWLYSVLFSFSNLLILNFFGLYHGIWRYASIHEIISIIKSIFLSTLFIIACLFLVFRLENIPRSFPILLFIISLFGVTAPRVFYRFLKDSLTNQIKQKIPVLVVGDNNSTNNFIRITRTEKSSPYDVVGIICKEKNSLGRRIHNVPIISVINDLDPLDEYLKIKKTISPQRIIICDNSISQKMIESLFIFSKKKGLAIGEVPKVSDISSASDHKFSARPIIIEDVLGRKQKVHDPELLKDIYDKVVLVTGAGGSIGSELCRQIYFLNPKKLIMFEQNEFALYKIVNELGKNSISVLGDIKDFFKLDKVISKYKPDIIFHSAALKHITFVEQEPMEALKTNFLATAKLCDLCKLHKIRKMVFISTDKAVNPTNIMGASKRLCEKYIQKISSDSKTFFSIVRFGNVLGSTGSVVPLFEEQIQKGGPVTITHPNVCRYFMTIREAVELVLISSQMKERTNGEILILEMGKPVLIKDLAKKMIVLSGKSDDDIKIEFTQLRKGEKLNEELLFKNERPTKTQVDGILSTQVKLFQMDMLYYNNLISMIQNNSINESMETFRKLLPEYR